MSKSFSQIKKELEQEWTAESVKGKVEYQVTMYRKSHDSAYGRVTVLLNKETVINVGYISRIILYGETLENREEALNSGMVDSYAFFDSYYEYINNSLDENIASDNALVRLFTILDRRIGKRRFKELKDTLVREAKWLEEFYDFRFKHEYI